MTAKQKTLYTFFSVKSANGPNTYIGETQETLETRISQHLGYISRNEQDKPAGRHFNSKGHSAADMEVLVLEKIHQNDAFYRKEREHVHIKDFDLVRKGLNGKK